MTPDAEFPIIIAAWIALVYGVLVALAWHFCGKDGCPKDQEPRQ